MNRNHRLTFITVTITAARDDHGIGQDIFTQVAQQLHRNDLLLRHQWRITGWQERRFLHFSGFEGRTRKGTQVRRSIFLFVQKPSLRSLSNLEGLY